MKKALICVLISLLLLCACTQVSPDSQTPQPTARSLQDENETVETPSESTTSGLENLETVKNEIVPQYGAFGDNVKLIALDDQQAEHLKELAESSAMDSFPVLVDLYPTDRAGGLLVEIAPEKIEEEIRIGQDFLAQHYNANPADFNFKFNESVSTNTVSLETEEISAVVNLRKIHIQLSAPYEGEITAEAVAEESFVKTALEWVGIHTAEVRERIDPDIYGEVYRHIFTFAEHSDDPVEELLNFTFHAVTVNIYSSGLFSISIGYSDPIVHDSRIAVVSPEQLVTFLSETFPDNPPAEYLVEIFYNRKVEDGLFIPCYRIYLPEPNLSKIDGCSVYSVIEVTTTEMTP